MNDQEKKDLIADLKFCITLLKTSGINSKQIVINTLEDIVSNLTGEKKTESGLPF